MCVCFMCVYTHTCCVMLTQLYWTPYLQPHDLQLARLLCPWNFPGRKPEVGCHFLFQGIFLPKDQNCISCVFCIGRQILYHCTTQEALYTHIQSCLTLCEPMDCSPPGSSIHGIFQARILEWVAISFSSTHMHICKIKKLLLKK